MDILFVMPPFPQNGMSLAMRSPPMGLLSVAGAVDVDQHHMKLLDLNVDKKSDNELATIFSKFDVVALSMMTNVYVPAMRILGIAKAAGATTIVGGFHPSLCPEMVENDEVDIAVRGEGEVAFAELLENQLDPTGILGVTYLKNGEVHHNEDRPLTKDLDTLPFPAMELIDPDDYYYLYLPATVIEGSRGCPFACDFCCVSSVYHRKYREKSPERVLEELKRVQPNVKVLFFVDDNFTMNMKRVDRICDMMREEIDQKIIYACQSRVDTIVKHPDVIAKMGEVGFKLFFLGVESIHQKALDHMGKQIKAEQITKAVEILHENGILSYGSFIVGNVGETRDDVLKTIDFIKKVRFTFIQAGAITPYPATKLYDDALENGWLKEENRHWWQHEHDHALMDTPDLTREEIGDLTRQTMKSFYYDWKKYVSPAEWATVLSKQFRWWRELAPTVIVRGIRDFLLRF